MKPFRWADVVLPQHDLENATPLNRQRMILALAASPLALADLLDAAKVILLSKAARTALNESDPKALGQLEAAMALCAPELPNPHREGDAVIFRDAERPQYVKIAELGPGDPRVAAVFGDGTSRYLMPWDYRIAPDPDPQAE